MSDLNDDLSSQTEIRLVPAAEVDMASIAALVNEAFYIHPMVTRERTSPEALAQELGDTGEIILALLDGQVVGSALIRPAAEMDTGLERDALHQYGPALYYGLAGVKPELMRRGIGRSMLNAAEHIAAEREFPRVVLTALREMGNVDYYSQRGYAVVHHWDFQLGGADSRLCLMAKDV